MKQQATPLQFNLNLQAKQLSNRRMQGLLTGLMTGMHSGFYINSLETGVSKTELQELLIASPRLRNESSVTEMLNFLQDEGDRTAYAILLPHLLASTDKKEQEKIIREQFFGIELFIRRTQNLHCFLTIIQQENNRLIGKEELRRGILAWDMGLLVNLARIAYETENITKKEAWNYIEFAGKQCKKSFANWEEVGKSFLLGQAMEAENEATMKQAIACFQLAIQSNESPWKTEERVDYFSRSTT